MKKYFFILFGLFLTHSAFAIEVISPTETIPGATTPTSFIANIISYAIMVAGILGVIGMTWAGVQFILASGEEEKVKKARYMIIYCAIGVLLSGMAYQIVKIISNFRF